MKELDKVAEAQKVLMEAEQKISEEFINEYKKLCEKYGRELTANVVWNIRPISK